MLSWKRLTTLMLAVAAGFFNSHCRQRADERPNILFVFTDDHASHAISAYGSRINQTPNIDRLAREGMLFRNVFCANSICAPSRATVLTGKHSHLNGQITNRETFDGSQQTFPKLLRQSGYQTAMIGKWHLKSEPTGFNYWNVLIGQGTYYNPTMRTRAGGEVVTRQHTGYTTDILTDLALEWLEQGRDSSKPFLLMYQHKAPHREWTPSPLHYSLYDDVEIPEPETLFDDWDGRAAPARYQTMTVSRHLNDHDLKLAPPDYLNEEQIKVWHENYDPENEAMRRENLTGSDLVRWKYQRYIKDYLRCIASVDDNLGRVLDYLDRTGLSDNTVVIYSSDQGFYLGDHGWFDKRWMYEESLRMPFIVRWPAVVEPGSENSDLVQNIDFAETFLDLAEVDVPEDMQGHSIVPLLQGKRPGDWRTSLYYHYYELPGWHDVQRHYGVRNQRYKLIHYYDFDEWELFDLEVDPQELTSVYSHPDYQDTVRQLEQELERLRIQYQVDRFQEPEAPPDPRRVELELALHYDGQRDAAGRFVDRSGNGCDAAAPVGVVAGRRALAFHFDGQSALQCGGQTADGPDPVYRPLTVGAWCNPEANSGVVTSQGDANFGYSLYLKDGVPHFAVRAYGLLSKVAANTRVGSGRWVHLAATISPDMRLTLRVNGRPVAVLEQGELIRQRPAETFSVGADPGGRVDDDGVPQHFRGLIEDVRLYWGVPDEATLRQWLR